jgi:hypothetical protein
MAKDISKWPLLVLMEHFNAWIASARSPALWNPEADHQCWADSLRGEAKEVIIWLELKGLDEAASQLEKRMAAFRAAVWEFQHACEGTYPPEDEHCHELAEVMVHKAGLVAGICEDLDQEVPQDVWEGFLDA